MPNKFILTEENIKKLCEKTHRILCYKYESCSWLADYKTEAILKINVWDLPYHKKWLEHTKNFISKYDYSVLANFLEKFESVKQKILISHDKNLTIYGELQQELYGILLCQTNS